MIVDVGGAEGEDGGAWAAQQQLRQHEDEDGEGGRPGRLLDAVVFPVTSRQSKFMWMFPVLRIRIRRIHMFLGLPAPDPSIIKQK